ncbi:MAG TPA: glycosyltransferase family 4 protein [Roseiflexaceae bacterium]|nr:glycosyltransferase family 4 protein [Roseiflexaceae bacterium]
MTLRILLVHNRYRERGGEESVFEDERALLEQHGHPVACLEVDNEAIPDQRSIARSAQLALDTIWSRRGAAMVAEACAQFQPQIVHFHNTFPQISPAAYYACRDAGCAVVQTLHNYRLLCLNALLFREGRVCEECVGRSPLSGLRHRCYRGSMAASSAVAAMLVTHRMLGTWQRAVDRYIALSDFARSRLIAGGLPAERLVVKPNFLAQAPPVGEHQGGFALFVGRFTEEKGVRVMLRAWEQIGERVPLRIVGDGALAGEVRRAASQIPGVSWLGKQPRTAVRHLMQQASMLIFPSIWYEGFPMVIVEAFAHGLPVLGSAIGSMTSIIEHGSSGLQLPVGDAERLAEAVIWLDAHPAECRRMGAAARLQYEQRYSAEHNYRQLMSVYRQAIQQAAQRSERRTS